MAPLRSQRAAARANRNQADNDVLSGMPVRQYVKAPITVSLVPPKIPRPTKDTVWKELPMPKGSELYPMHSQQILRQARMPWIPPEDRDDPDDGDDDGEGEDAEAFTVSKWVLVPQGQERPTKNLLADRPKSLPPLYGGAPGQAPMRKVKVRRVDADGSVTFFEVLAPAGVPIEGEVAPAEAPAVATEAIAPGTVVEGVGVANSEGVVVAGEAATPQSNRRKPPPPKRKKHGPGRGRKKKVMLETRNADGTTEITEAAISGRTEGDDDDGDDDDGDDDGKEDGEMSDEVGTPTPTPSRGGLHEPPRSVPVDMQPTNLSAVTAAAPPPVVVVEPDIALPQIREPEDQGLASSADAMQVDHLGADTTAIAPTESTETPAQEGVLQSLNAPPPSISAPLEPPTVAEIGAETFQQAEPATTSATSLHPAVVSTLDPDQSSVSGLASEPLVQALALQDSSNTNNERPIVEADKLSNASQAGSPPAADAVPPAVEAPTDPMDLSTIAPESEPNPLPETGPTESAAAALRLPIEQPIEPLSEPAEVVEAAAPTEDVMAVDSILQEPVVEEAPVQPPPIPEPAALPIETNQTQDFTQIPTQLPAQDESEQVQTQAPVDAETPITAALQNERKPIESIAPLSDTQPIEPPFNDATAREIPTSQPGEVPATVAGESIPPVPAPVADPLPEPAIPNEPSPAPPLTEPEPLAQAQTSEPLPAEPIKSEDARAVKSENAAPMPDLLNPAPESSTHMDIKDGTEPGEPTAANPDPLAVPSFPEVPPADEGDGGDGEAGQTQATKEDGVDEEKKATSTPPDAGGVEPPAVFGVGDAGAGGDAETSADAGAGSGTAAAAAGADAEPPVSMPAPAPVESGTAPEVKVEELPAPAGEKDEVAKTEE